MPAEEYKSVRIPEDCWKVAAKKAIDERSTIQDIVEAALREYLKIEKGGSDA